MSSVSVSLRIPEDLAAELDEVAQEADRSRSYVLLKALEAYLQDRADLEVALHRLHDPTEKDLSEDEVRSEIGL